MTKKNETLNVSNTSEIIERLEQEFNEVADRFEKLDAALEQGKKFAKKVGYEQANLMIDQREAMEHYRNILAIRIALLKRKKCSDPSSSAKRNHLKEVFGSLFQR